MKLKISRLVSLFNFEVNLFTVSWSKLKETIKGTWSVILKYQCDMLVRSVRAVLQKFFFGFKEGKVEKLSIWQHFLISCKYRVLALVNFFHCFVE